MTSLAEALVVEFREEMAADAVLKALAAQLPAGLKLESARRLETTERLQPALVRYRLERGELSTAELEQRTHDILASNILEVNRVNHRDGTTRT